MTFTNVIKTYPTREAYEAEYPPTPRTLLEQAQSDPMQALRLVEVYLGDQHARCGWELRRDTAQALALLGEAIRTISRMEEQARSL